MCYGLRTDFKTHLFEGSKRLFEIADTIEEIKSSCECDNKCIFNARIDKYGNVVVDGEQIEIGGDDRYTSMCRKCYHEKTKHPLYIKNNEEEY
jgi:thymidine kinase